MGTAERELGGGAAGVAAMKSNSAPTFIHHPPPPRRRWHIGSGSPPTRLVRWEVIVIIERLVPLCVRTFDCPPERGSMHKIVDFGFDMGEWSITRGLNRLNDAPGKNQWYANT